MQGQRFTIRFTIDSRYMLTAEQTVANSGSAPVVVQPYAFINRTSRTRQPGHAGPSIPGRSAHSAARSISRNNYKDVAKAGEVTPQGQPDWIGFTDIYWLSALIPQGGAGATGRFPRARARALPRRPDLRSGRPSPAGQAVTRTTRLFAGAKESDVLNRYEDAGIAKFGLAIDWGWFRWFEIPIFWLLQAALRAGRQFRRRDHPAHRRSSAG